MMDVEKAPTICLYVNHFSTDDVAAVTQSIYLIQPTLDSEPQENSPLLTFSRDTLLLGSDMINLGSKMYFLGGEGVEVYVFDTEQPSLGIKQLAPMHTPKVYPCIFVADGMIYAIDRNLIYDDEDDDDDDDEDDDEDDDKKEIKRCTFECYNPISNRWSILPNPPLDRYFHSRTIIDYKLNPTVVGRRVFIGHSHLIFNLDTLEWYPLLPTELALRFPFDSIFCGDYLYYLRGQCAWNFGHTLNCNSRFPIGESTKVVKRGPLPLPLPDNGSLLKLPCFDFGTDMDHVVTPDSDLVDPNIYFNSEKLGPWKSLFHMGGRFFCYVVTAQLVERDSNLFRENSRGVWIKFFEACEQTSQFRTLASFCYEIDTNFVNNGHFISCCVLGSIPHSWIEALPGNKVQVRHLRQEGGVLIPINNKASSEEQKDVGKGYNPGLSLHELNDVNAELLAYKEENRRLKDELSRIKDELLMATLVGRA